MQRIFPLEINSSESNEITREGSGVEESDSSKPSDPKYETLSDDIVIKKYTSSGRCIKEPKRLDLLNNVCYIFETLPDSQRGEDVRSEMKNC